MPRKAASAAKEIARTFRGLTIRGLPADFESRLTTWAEDPSHVHHDEDTSRKPHEWSALCEREAEALLEHAAAIADSQDVTRALAAYQADQATIREKQLSRLHGQRPATLGEAVKKAMKWAHHAALLSTNPGKAVAFESIKLGLRVLLGDRPASCETVAEAHRQKMQDAEQRANDMDAAFARGEASEAKAGAARAAVFNLRREHPTADLMPTAPLYALASVIEGDGDPLQSAGPEGTQERMRVALELIERAAADGFGTPRARAKRLCSSLRSQLPTEFKLLTAEMCDVLSRYAPNRPKKGQLTAAGIAAHLALQSRAFGFSKRTTQDDAVRAFDNARHRQARGKSRPSRVTTTRTSKKCRLRTVHTKR